MNLFENLQLMHESENNVVKESTERIKDFINKMNDNITGLKLLRKDVLLCSNEDELLTIINKYSKEYGRLVAPRISELSGSLEDKQEQILDHIQEMKAFYTTELDKYNNELEIADSTFSELLKVVKNGPFNAIESKSSKYVIYFDTTIESQTELAEYFRKELGARYYGTGYGGSWTAHDLLLPNGAEIKVGKLSKKIGVEIESVHNIH